MDSNELKLLSKIDEVLRNPSIAKKIDQIADRVEKSFLSSTEGLAWETIPLDIYENSMPEGIRSSWVFLLRENSNSGPERHPNSHQRVTSWRRKGDLQIWEKDRWESHILSPDFGESADNRWASIPINTWHQAVVGSGEHWIVVSFHTASAEELIEERPDSADANLMRQRVYTKV
jgi:hypothetical protein